MMSVPLCVTFFFFFFVNLLSSFNSSISQEIEILTVLSNQITLVSPGNVFEFGLFKPETEKKWYLGIWYKEDVKRTILWVGNRRNPLTTPGGTLKLTDNELILYDQDNDTVWSQYLTGGSVRSPVVAELHDNGNFVIKESEKFLWQSFDSPTDTLLPQMNLNFLDNSSTISLISWLTANDPSDGHFTFQIQKELKTFAILNYGQRRRDTWNGYQFGDMPPVFNLKDDDSFVMKTLQNTSSYSRLTVARSGDYELYSWNSEAKEWNLSWSTNREPCLDDCGTYSYCSQFPYRSCQCIRGFKKKSEHKWNGCLRRTALSCTDNNFVQLRNMNLPAITSTTQFIEGSMDIDSCNKSCVSRCGECTAFALVENRKGQGNCLIWDGELEDLRNYTSGGQTIYVRLAAKDYYPNADADQGHGMEAWLVGLIVGASILGCLITCSFIYCLWKKIIKKKIEQDAVPRDTIMNEIAGPADRFQFVEFSVVAEATDQFSEANKIGQGGFGPVYKGRLRDGTQVAVKRLANTSSQGIQQFKNEVHAIRNVLHLNLVKLNGCCCQGEEIILIYEYFENGSLNNYIFDETRSSFLNWGKRYGIVKGIADGLSYLHSYANPPIIHRDLKPSNILLGQDMIPKISDFGLAKILENDQTQAETDKPVGTRGYMSEEYAMDNIMSERSDVFSFGVTVLEIITGERNIDYCNSHRGDSLLDKAWRYWNEGRSLQLVDSLFIDSTMVEEEVMRAIQVSLLCVQGHVEDRPSAKSVVLMLDSIHFDIPNPTIPDYFYSRFLRGETASSSSSAIEPAPSLNYATQSLFGPR